MFNNKINLIQPKVVLFDWDDTLVDTGKIYRTILQEVLQELGIKDWDKEAALKYKFYSRRDSLPLIFKDDWERVNKAFLDKIHNVDLKEVFPLENALNTIQKLVEDNIIVSIVSNKDSKQLRSEVEFLGWGQYFNKIIGSGDALRDKPWPVPAQLALQNISLSDKDAVWFIGDSIVDIQCAKENAFIPILFGHNDMEIHKKIEYLKISYGHVKNHDELLITYKALR